MNNFWSLVGFEYKKIFVRKSVYVAIVILLAIAAVSTVATLIGKVDPNDPDSLSYYEEMLIYKEYDLALSGKALDGDLILLASEAYAKIPDDVYPYSDSAEYQEYALAYSKVFTTVDSAYTSRNVPFGYKEFGQLTQEKANSYYEIRTQQYRLNLENNPLFSQENIERIMAIDSEVQKPIIMQYADGYTRHIALSTSNTIALVLIIAFILSPIFANEYEIKTGNLILTAKNGKKHTMLAKAFVGVSISLALAVVTLLISFFGCMFVYGFEGANASIQNYIALLTYNFTMLDVVLVLFVLTLLSSFMMASISLFFSAICKKSSLALILCVMVLLMDISGIGYYLGKVQHFLPSGVGTFNTFYLQLSFNVFGMDLWLYQAAGLVAFIVGILLLLLVYYKFNNQSAK